MLKDVFKEEVQIYIRRCSFFKILMLCSQRDVPLVLFFDELDLLVAANPAVKDSFLGFLRSIRQDQSTRAKPAVLAVVGIGSYSTQARQPHSHCWC